jgi:hypothetical protein
MPAGMLSQADEVMPENEGCDLIERFETARQMLEPIAIEVGSRSYRYTEYRGRTVTFKDPEKTIALALMDTESCAIETTVIRKRGDDLIAPPGYDIEPVVRNNGIRWNNWATEFAVSEPTGRVVVALKYPYLKEERSPRTVRNKAGKRVTVFDTKRVLVPVYYTPYSKELHVPELVQGGEEYLTALATRVYDDLRERGVPSQSVPGTPVADVTALRPEYVVRLAPIEHMDMAEFLIDPAWTTDRIHIVIGANRERVATYTCSPESACGLMQFTAGTYKMMRGLYPEAGLIASFDEGARDQFNAMKAAVLLHDYNTGQLVDAFGDGIMDDPRLEEYLAAAYNTGVGRVIAVLDVARSTKADDWAQVSGRTKIQRLLTETKGYIAKLRFLKEDWEPHPIAQAEPRTPRP